MAENTLLWKDIGCWTVTDQLLDIIQKGQNMRVTVIGGGIAGTEAAWQIAQAGVPVTLYEMRPTQTSPAHHSEELAELVCSNSFGAQATDRAAGLLLYLPVEP
jgi:glycine/D-amino acid oxidase-like deaminating enzyme